MPTLTCSQLKKPKECNAQKDKCSWDRAPKKCIDKVVSSVSCIKLRGNKCGPPLNPHCEWNVCDQLKCSPKGQACKTTPAPLIVHECSLFNKDKKTCKQAKGICRWRKNRCYNTAFTGSDKKAKTAYWSKYCRQISKRPKCRKNPFCKLSEDANGDETLFPCIPSETQVGKIYDKGTG